MIFINYRKADTQAAANHLAKELRKEFGRDNVFYDHSSISPGDPWPDHLKDAVRRCQVLLALVGKDWLRQWDHAGRRRIDLEDDWVRQEITLALQMGKDIVVIAVDGARHIEQSDCLTGALEQLSAIQCQPLRSDRDSDRDIQDIIKLLKPKIRTESRRSDIAPYLKWIIENCSWLDHGLLKSFSRRLSREHLMVERRYVKVEVDVWAGNPDPVRQELIEAIDTNQHLGLLGEPGEGKTTGFRYAALRHANAALRGEKPAPVLIKATTIAESLSESNEPAVWDFLEAWDSKARRHVWDLGNPWLKQTLEAGAHVMIDDLDRVPDQRREMVFKLIRECANRYPDSRWCVVSRAFAWQDVLLPNFRVATICELSDEAIREFVEAWARDFASAFPPAARHQTAAQTLLRNMQDNPALRDLARRPLFLTAICIIHWLEQIPESDNRQGAHPTRPREIPTARADLLRLIIEWLLGAHPPHFGAFAAQNQMEVYAAIAFAMSSLPASKRSDIDELSQQLAGILPNLRSLNPRTVRDYLRRESRLGLLREENGVWRFLNRSFQDFLTAWHLAADGVDWTGVVKTHFQDPEWSDRLALFAGLLASDKRLGTLDELVRVLLSVGDTLTLPGKAAAVGHVVHVFRDVHATKYDLDTVEEFRAMAEEIAALFDPQKAPHIEVKDRYEVVVALGVRGDLRLRGTTPDMVGIAGGAVCVGAQSRDPTGSNYDARATSTESPVALVVSGAFEIGRYPVTVHEYERFVDDGGYDSQRGREYWSSKGWEWKEREKRTSPDKWDEQRRRLTFPVTRVSNFEAQAYCRWLTRKANDNYVYRLPSEDEWEFAVRRQDAAYHAYAWGNEPKNLSNIFGFNQLVPIGFFLEDRTQSGISDISCNVSEWTCDDWDSDRAPGPRLARRLVTDDREIRCKTIKGGHYRHSLKSNRTSVRSAKQEQLGFDYVGFRVLRKLKPIKIKEERPTHEYAASLADYYELYAQQEETAGSRLTILNGISAGLGDRMEAFLAMHFPLSSPSRLLLPCRLGDCPDKFGYNLLYQDSRIKVVCEKRQPVGTLASDLAQEVDRRQRAIACVVAFSHQGPSPLWHDLNDNDLDAIVFAVLDHFEPGEKDELKKRGLAVNDTALAALPSRLELERLGLAEVMKYQVFAGVRLLHTEKRELVEQFDKPCRFGPFMISEFQQWLSRETQMLFLFDDNGELVWDLALIELLLDKYPQLEIVGIISTEVVGNNATAETLEACLVRPRFADLRNNHRFVVHKETNPRSCIDPACASPQFRQLWESAGCFYIKGVAAFETLQSLPKPAVYAFVVYSDDSRKCTGYERDTGVLFAAQPGVQCFKYGDPTCNLKKLHENEESP